MMVNLAGFVSFLIAVMLLRDWQQLDAVSAALIALGALALPIILLELLGRHVHRRPSAGLAAPTAVVNWRRVGIKLLGYYLTLAIIASAYWLFPVYRTDFYQPFWALLEIVLPLLVLVAIPYFAWLDRRMQRPQDGYWQMGMLVLGRWSTVHWTSLRQYALSWLVKGFFLPLMFGFFQAGVAFFREVDFYRLAGDAAYSYNFFWELFYTIDLVFVVVGYALTLRLLDAHIRTTEPTLSGWLVALVSYEPFWTLIYASYLAYNVDRLSWGNWLADSSVLYVAWGASILLLTALYAFCSVAFGLRFSNLTHRGIITNGPYRYSKHPAYVTKNISWWLIAIPFIINSTPFDALRDCLLLLGVNLIYFARARTEERHLSWDPVYVEYALAMNRRSVFRGFVRWLPYLRYRPPLRPLFAVDSAGEPVVPH
jgi:isoprenylcysteine carboxyl methyltransferase (ICMT) family protein YpbQ